MQMRNFAVMAVLASFAAFGLSGCTTTGTATEVRYQTVTVTKRGPCPAEPVYAAITAARPVPLRNQTRPASGVERVARNSAQLGLYERPGGWADKVATILARCQVAGVETEQAEGVASGP